MILLHGEHIVASRKKLSQLLQKARHNQQSITTFSAKTLVLAQLEISLQPTNLFGQTQVVVIEELHSLPTSQRKKELIALLASVPPDTSLILWEKRTLTLTMLKQFPHAQVQVFPLTKILFTWLETIGSKDTTKSLSLLRQAVTQEGEMACFIMLVRQIRLLLLCASGGTPSGAPFMVKKLQSQAKRLDIKQLLVIHTALHQLDQAIKSSRLPTTLAQQLEWIIITTSAT